MSVIQTRKGATFPARWQCVRNATRLLVGDCVHFRIGRVRGRSEREVYAVFVVSPEAERERLLNNLEQRFRHDEKIAARAMNRENRKRFLAVGTQSDASA